MQLHSDDYCGLQHYCSILSADKMWQSVIISKDGEFYALVMGCCNDKPLAVLLYSGGTTVGRRGAYAPPPPPQTAQWVPCYAHVIYMAPLANCT